MVARELALDMAECCYRPQVCAHTPGVANVLPDLLSRLQQPGKQASLPTFLLHIPDTQLPARTGEFYRAVQPLPLPAAVRAGGCDGAGMASSR